MKNFTLAAAILGASLIHTTAASAATIMLDDFVVDQLVADEPDLPSVPSSSSLGIGSGFTRTLTAENVIDGAQNKYQTSLESGAGILAFSNTDGSTGKVTVTYTGLDWVTFTSASAFVFNVGYFDGGALFTALIKDSNGNTSTYSETLGTLFNPTLLLSAFTGTADVSMLTSVTFGLDTSATNVPGVDGALNSIQISTVPVPAAGFLLVGALGGLVALRRKKQA